MKHIAILPLVLFFLSAGIVKSEAPSTGTVLSDLQAVISANKTVIDKQTKTLDVLDKLDQQAQQLKTFGNRG